MYGVLIVDDEEPVLESYGFILESGIDSFRLAGKARSGYEAIKLMYELKPDVVFMDINMPGLDGLDTIAEVHDKFPDTVFILSTAYERFDLARRAIPLGVFAYLVKPVSRKTFVETLDGVRTMLAKRRAGNHRSRESEPVLKFLKEFLWQPMDGDQWLECRMGLGLDSDLGLVAFIGLDSETDGLFTEFNAALSLKYRFLFAMHLGLGMYFFSGSVTRDDLESALPALLSTLVPTSVLSVIGLGSVRSGVELPLSCAEALEDLKQKKNGTDVRLRERLRIIQIRRKIGLSGREEVLELFNTYWEEIFAFYSFEMAKAKMIALFTLLIDDCCGCYQSHTEDGPPFIPSDEIQPLASLGEWQAWAQVSFDRLLQLSRQCRTGQLPIPLVKAIEFIDTNFDSQIQLPDAAAAASVSTAYLSRLFSEHMDSTFVDYLTVLRIERAEALIREKRMNIKEVSFAVGYQDPNYFSKIFRKIVGVSPSMYAERSRYEKE